MGTNHGGGNFGRRLPPIGGQYSTPINKPRIVRYSSIVFLIGLARIDQFVAEAASTLESPAFEDGRRSAAKSGDSVLPILGTSTAGRPAYFPVLDGNVQIARTTDFRRRSKYLGIKTLDPFCLFIRQRLEFSFSRPPREATLILMQKPEQQVGGAIRHIGDHLKVPRELIVAPEKIGFVRQVFLDRPAHAFEQEFGMRCGVEKAIEVRGVVEHPDIPALPSAPTQ